MGLQKITFYRTYKLYLLKNAQYNMACVWQIGALWIDCDSDT